MNTYAQPSTQLEKLNQSRMARTSMLSRPRHGKSSFISSSSLPSSSASHLASSSQSPTHSEGRHSCSNALPNDLALNQHLAATPACQVESHTGAVPEGEPARKRRRVTFADTPGTDIPTTNPPWIDEPITPITQPPSTPNPEPSQRAHLHQTGADKHATKPMRRERGLFVEEFSNPSAGAPISDERMPTPDLEAYMASSGRLADPELFNDAELLMTTGMTDAAKDRHLKSQRVSATQNRNSAKHLPMDSTAAKPHGPMWARCLPTSTYSSMAQNSTRTRSMFPMG